MEESKGWSWRIGAIHGVGQAAWQESPDGEVRRITHLLVSPQGFGFMKSPLKMLAKRPEELRADSIVAFSFDATDEVAGDLDRLWSGSLIMPANGQNRLKIIRE